MSAGAEQGYASRLAGASAADVQGVAVALLGNSCWSFSAASLWDAGDKDAQNLSLISAVATSAFTPRGDFGHAFAAQAELRWRRNDDGSFELLVLSEQPPAAGLGLRLIGRYTPHRASRDAAERLEPANGALDRLDRIEYRDEQAVVRFVRYSGAR